jgi:hypothetical protein
MVVPIELLLLLLMTVLDGTRTEKVDVHGVFAEPSGMDVDKKIKI